MGHKVSISDNAVFSPHGASVQLASKEENNLIRYRQMPKKEKLKRDGLPSGAATIKASRTAYWFQPTHFQAVSSQMFLFYKISSSQKQSQKFCGVYFL